MKIVINIVYTKKIFSHVEYEVLTKNKWILGDIKTFKMTDWSILKSVVSYTYENQVNFED